MLKRTIPSAKAALEQIAQLREAEKEIDSIFGHSRTAIHFKHNPSDKPIFICKNGWVLRYFHTRPSDTSDYILYKQSDLDAAQDYDRIPVIEFNCDNHTLKFNKYGGATIHKNIPQEVIDIVREFVEDPQYKTTPIETKPTSYLKMYIAVLDDVPDFIVPTLVAHSVLGAHLKFEELGVGNFKSKVTYNEWLEHSFRKCVIRVNRREFDKIIKLPMQVYLGHENKTLNGEKSCAVVHPVSSDNVPNVLKFAKLWSPVCP
ncbi:hypothetical protein FDH01_gp282 [Acinetobacter phage vB_AbaM_ME3]|uniref:Uncharacterized protein n=1 Tax=Acinetobacter phage vB_AbaM_ME3 TaxID=1837876 RepID=A0A172Q0F1_9CAUD|nr:hypothetical protein FDH01_gp282 [Acinetobacter phage vB_AbaM_ME3]AND75340.1 hypothetical protein ME3_179 [Acinetobacter phage vB_AbaM_ME3]